MFNPEFLQKFHLHYLLDTIHPCLNLLNHRTARFKISLSKINVDEMDKFEIRVRQVTWENTTKVGREIDMERKRDTTTDTVENLIEVFPRSVPRGKFVASHPIG